MHLRSKFQVPGLPRRSPESRPFPLHAAFRFRFRACAFQWLFLEVHLKLGKAGFRASVSPLALKKSTADLARRPCLICHRRCVRTHGMGHAVPLVH